MKRSNLKWNIKCNVVPEMHRTVLYKRHKIEIRIDFYPVNEKDGRIGKIQ